MKFRYRNEEEMKDSGVQWLGKIPREWCVCKMKHLLSMAITDGPHETPDLVESGVPFLSAESIVNSKISMQNKRGYITEEQYQIYAKKSRVHKNDILLCKSGSTTGKSAIVNTDEKFGIWSPLAIIRAEKDKIHFMNLFYVIQSKYFRIQVENYWTFGTQPNIGMESLENLYIPFSPLTDNQLKIVNFLDEKTSQFDTIISKKEYLITRLEEAKKSLISEVVTGKVKVVKTSTGYELVERKKEEMKDSGVEWLGEVPRDWYIKSIKRLSRIGRGASPRPIDNPNYFDDNGEYAWTRIADVTASDKYLIKTLQKTSQLGASLSVKLEPNNLFLSIAGSVGKPCITSIKACIHDGFVYFHDLEEYYVDYLYFIFYGGQCYKGLGKLGTQLNLNRETVGDIKIAIPKSKEEIKFLSLALDEKLNNLTSLINDIENQINEIKKAKQSLISEAVTGKIEILD